MHGGSHSRAKTKAGSTTASTGESRASSCRGSVASGPASPQKRASDPVELSSLSFLSSPASRGNGGRRMSTPVLRHVPNRVETCCVGGEHCTHGNNDERDIRNQGGELALCNDDSRVSFGLCPRTTALPDVGAFDNYRRMHRNSLPARFPGTDGQFFSQGHEDTQLAHRNGFVRSGTCAEGEMMNATILPYMPSQLLYLGAVGGDDSLSRFSIFPSRPGCARLTEPFFSRPTSFSSVSARFGASTNWQLRSPPTSAIPSPVTPSSTGFEEGREMVYRQEQYGMPLYEHTVWPAVPVLRGYVGPAENVELDRCGQMVDDAAPYLYPEDLKLTL